MIPVVTPEEMRAIDDAAPEPVEELIERAGAAVARVALEELGGGYGRRVVVVAGKGNNGADGRAAAARLRRRGVRVQIFDAGSCPATLPPCDLVIDAAYGTGFRGEYPAPDPGAARVLAVDIPSGVDGATGDAGDGAVRADVTVALAALKPGLLFTDRAGAIVVADIGLDVSGARIHAVDAGDVSNRLPRRGRHAHKYASGVVVVAGSPGMSGAAVLTARAAMRAGAGYCRLGVPGLDLASSLATGIVAVELPPLGWAAEALKACERMRSLAIGPGLGRTSETAEETRRVVAEAPLPMVVDADGLFALGAADDAARVLGGRSNGSVLTPHDGEFARLTGSLPPSDRIAAARSLAMRLSTTVLLKGPTTIVAGPQGDVLLSTVGSPALATAGTGDVLTGIIAAFLALGLPPLEAGGLAAAAHGAAALRGRRAGLIASDLPDLVAGFLSSW